MTSSKRYVERPPRLQPILPHGTVQIPAPPGSNRNEGSLIRQVALPLITVGGFLLVTLLTNQGQGDLFLRILTILPMGVAALVTTTLAWRDWRHQRQEESRLKEAYLLQLTDLRRQMQLEHQQQQEFYLYNYPNMDVTLRITSSSDNNLNSRLWERRSTDNDFGALRLGIGNRNSTVVYQTQTTKSEDSVDLIKEAERLAADSQTVEHVPILMNLFSQPQNDSPADESAKQASPKPASFPVYHTVGISGKTDDVYPLIHAILAGFTAFHSPAEANVLLVAPSSAANAWTWLRPLPHCPPSRRRDQRQVYPICIEESTSSTGTNRVKAFWRYLRTELERRETRLQDKDSKFDKLPFLLVVVDMLNFTVPGSTETSTLQDIEGEAAVAKLMQVGDKLGVATLFLTSDRNRLPSQCQAVLEVAHSSTGEGRVFRFAGVGAESERFRGQADGIEFTEELAQFALKLSKLNIRLAYGQDIPAALGFMEMFNVQTLEDFNMAETWVRSKQPDAADWMSGLVGVMSGGESRQLTYSADRDGVHGMVAGSTGSGKSELLMTLILGLAVRYDPSIINFVLIDFKGGAAFEPFRKLPHCVDIVTNLEGAAVDRMFAAIIAELNRRQEINRREEVKHIVHYRQKGYHLDPARPPYPHLFVFIDEFAEMIAGNAEYKKQLDSITRLGRALGVSLILAAQRPTGVTDQMRANIKFRICLRVETREESGEMLRRPDAAYLPPGVPGRGYLQIGNENIELIQVAYSGEDYLHNVLDDSTNPEQSDALNRDIVWLKRLGTKFEAPKLFEVLVADMDRLSRQSGAPPQKKPWPSPLPKILALTDFIPEIEYIPPYELAYSYTLGATEDSLRFHPILADWLGGTQASWKKLDWAEQAMHAIVGLIDDPSSAAQHIFRLNLQSGHAAVFGTSAAGKSTLLRTVTLSLAAVHSPENLHMYLVDFGNRSLDVLSTLPHVGAFITANEEERLQRLLAFLTTTIEQRKQTLAAARANSLYSYNQNPANRPMPSILVMIDNFSELKESFEDYLPQITSLIRDGLVNGLHFVVTGEQSNSIPSKIFALFTERLALKLSEIGEYGNIVGRGVTAITDIPGRGYLVFQGHPLEFQVLLPVIPTDQQRAVGSDETKALAEIVDNIKIDWDEIGSTEISLLPAPIHILPLLVTLESILPVEEPESSLMTAPLGIDDRNLGPAWIDLSQVIHAVVTGTQISGKTSTLWSWIISLAYQYPPSRLAIVLVDSLGYLADYRGSHSLGDIPHVLSVVSEADQMTDLIAHLTYEYETLPPGQAPARELFIFIDNYDDFGDLKPDTELLTRLTRSKPGRSPIHFIISGTPLAMRGGDDFLRRVTQSRFGIATNGDAVTESPHNANLPRSLRNAELPAGRGFIVRSGIVATTQLAMPYHIEDGLEKGLDEWVEKIKDRWSFEDGAEWLEIPADLNTNADNDPFSDDEEAPPLDPALVAAAHTALESILDAAILNNLPPVEMVALAQSYDLLGAVEVDNS